jgi:hypothetical protein
LCCREEERDNAETQSAQKLAENPREIFTGG